MSELLNILEESVKIKASDVHFRPNAPVWIRLNGDLMPFNKRIFKNEELLTIFKEIVPSNKNIFFERGEEVDFAFQLSNSKTRFRINLYRDLAGISASFRVLPSEIISVYDLNIEKPILDLCGRQKGLILVTGPTGSGKSTTLASLLDYVNTNQNGHLITIEDPIEFIFEEKNCIINQREINTHTHTFENALRAALREDPDYIMVGEMRDLETTMTAIEVAETGHLVFSTLHTNTAASTIYRIINQFPKKMQDQIRIAIASSLIGVISQTLIPKADGSGRIAVRETLVVNHAIANLIRENKVYQIPNIIQMNRKEGMITMNDALIELVESNEITPIDAMQKAPDPLQLEKMLAERGLF